MLAIEERPDGTYAISSTAGPQFLVVTRDWLQQLVNALCDAGLIQQHGVRIRRTGGQ